MHTGNPIVQASTTATDYLQFWRNMHPLWYYSTLGYLALALLFLIAQGFDDRLLLGISVWAKPFKFAISIAVYFGTMTIFVEYMPQGYFAKKRGRLLTVIPVATALFEMVYIAIQAALGEPSHYNRETSFNATMYTLMGIGATAMVAALLWMGMSIARSNKLSNPMVLAIVIGLVLTFLLGGGFGSYLGNHPGHWVGGTSDDASGLWLFKWARDGGDLRVAHFFGMHAMQVMPMFAWLLPKSLPRVLSVASVIVFATAYTAFSWLTFNQAIQGQPFMG
jgi:NO-binding membrane sensor protein with MHYT domain